jgi:hypothetical protein
MASSVDGWGLIRRMAAEPERFAACESTAALAARLLIRTQLVRGVRSAADLQELVAVMGGAAMAEIIADLAGYEALRVMRNLGDEAWEGDRRTADVARRRIQELAETPAPPQKVEASVRRTLSRHNSFSARRIRADEPPP